MGWITVSAPFFSHCMKRTHFKGNQPDKVANNNENFASKIADKENIVVDIQRNFIFYSFKNNERTEIERVSHASCRNVLFLMYFRALLPELQQHIVRLLYGKRLRL